MKIITVIAQQVSAEALNTALPDDGIVSVSVSGTQAFSRSPASVGYYRGVKVPQHFTPMFRIELEVDDNAVDTTIDGLAFARSAGLFGDARVRLSDGSAIDVFASARTQAA